MNRNRPYLFMHIVILPEPKNVVKQSEDKRFLKVELLTVNDGTSSDDEYFFILCYVAPLINYATSSNPKLIKYFKYQSKTNAFTK
ncbi:hypothetical protein NSQ96_09900 [Caldifermentibacillus hisashii]|uniref:hypothetical protein n=1 Tax=Caldifermentibacillus hisashii TaxID=996558 RepID=UPI0031FD8391